MKLNQFAIAPTTPKNVVDELINIRFIHKEMLKQTPQQVFFALLSQSFPELKRPNSDTASVGNLMATPDLSVEHIGDTITPTIFANVYLQLLGFEPGEDFDLASPYAIKHHVNLPHFDANLSTNNLISGWYQLLVTHTVHGQTFLDELASRGYFEAMVHDPDTPRPLFFNGKAQPVYNTHNLIYETVYVESPQDSDSDGNRDLLKVEITRPGETQNAIKFPVLYTASPYNQGTNDAAGERLTHSVNVPLTKKTPHDGLSTQPTTHEEIPARSHSSDAVKPAEEGVGNGFEYSLNDYFLARGFAVVYAAGIGTKQSDGLRTTGDPQETVSTVSVIKWLTGDLPAFTSRNRQYLTTAFWSNGNVAMTGRSYLGTLAIAAATTGVKGLKTIIEEAGISSWYDYYREGGLVVAPGGFPGEDADVLALETFSRQKQAADYHQIEAKWQAQLAAITAGQDRDTGDYNAFWDARNYRKDVKNIKADVVIVHGLNDWNVKPRNAGKLWRDLRDLPINKKIILHQGPHIYINNFRSLDFTDMMNLWLSYQLYDVQNGADKLLPDVLIQDNATPETWHTQQDWAAPDNPTIDWYGEMGKLTTQTPNQPAPTKFNDLLSTGIFNRYAANPTNWADDMMTPGITPLTGHRILLRSDQLTAPLTIDGVPQLTITITSDQPVGLVSARLVDYGHFKRLKRLPDTLEGQAMDMGYHYRKENLREYELGAASDYQLISLGHLNLQNTQGADTVTAITPNQPMTATFELQPTHYTLSEGHQLGLLIYATDFEMTVRGNQNITYTVDWATTHLTLPTLPH